MALDAAKGGLVSRVWEGKLRMYTGRARCRQAERVHARAGQLCLLCVACTDWQVVNLYPQACCTCTPAPPPSTTAT